MFTLGRLKVSRWATKAYIKAFRETRPPTGETIFDPAIKSTLLSHLRADGISEGLILPSALVTQIREFAATHSCYGDASETWPLSVDASGIPRSDGAAVGDYIHGIAACAPLCKLSQDRTLLEIASEYLGTTPRPLRSRLWWSFPPAAAGKSDRSNFQGLFHYDLDDWLAVKFFFYLTDVDANSGPHAYVKTSHRNRSLRDQLLPMKARSMDFLYSRYGRASILSVEGPAGSGIVQDPFGYHAGTAVRDRPRLMMEMSFGVSDMPQVGPWTKATAMPAEVPGTGPDSLLSAGVADQ
jgi:hypothetical protein